MKRISFLTLSPWADQRARGAGPERRGERLSSRALTIKTLPVPASARFISFGNTGNKE